jgi:hypothetical protein
MFQAVKSTIARRRALPVQSPAENAAIDITGQRLRQRLTDASGIHRMHCIVASWEEGLIDAADAKAMLRRELNHIAGVA